MIDRDFEQRMAEHEAGMGASESAALLVERHRALHALQTETARALFDTENELARVRQQLDTTRQFTEFVRDREAKAQVAREDAERRADKLQDMLMEYEAVNFHAFEQAIEALGQDVLARVGTDALILTYGGWEHLTKLLRLLVEMHRDFRVYNGVGYSAEFEQLVADAEATI